MSVLKWVLIVLGAIVAILLIIIGGSLYWASTVESVKVTEADVKVGGAYSEDERKELLDICNTKYKKGAEGDDRCVCAADHAGKDFSRFERLVFLATVESNPTRVVALFKGLMASGMGNARVEELQKDTKNRIEGVLKTCGLH